MPAPLSIDISRNSEGWPDAFDARADQAVRAALAQSKARIAGPAELSIVLTDDAEQRVLNRDWRGIDKSTNVLSFPQIEPFAPVSGLLGDIILARETLEREAAEQGVSVEDHFTHLVVHGFLHLLGYDHMDDDEALAMEGLETQILASLGVADPYADD
ncbi:MAG: rRNA maturation RNase YbeY [Devosia sp. 67-54]|nr:MAG: rRNA maturation RNase YbeY [Devosia sp. 67-54]